LAREKVNVILISQASSEHSICFAVESSMAGVAKKAIEKEFQYELKNEEIDEVQVEGDLSIVAVVGDGMKHSPGTSGRMFSALGRNGVNVVAIAQGASERNISAVVRQVDRSEEHTSELQSRENLVCRLRLEKKKYREVGLVGEAHPAAQLQQVRNCVLDTNEILVLVQRLLGPLDIVEQLTLRPRLAGSIPAR